MIVFAVLAALSAEFEWEINMRLPKVRLRETNVKVCDFFFYSGLSIILLSLVILPFSFKLDLKVVFFIVFLTGTASCFIGVVVQNKNFDLKMPMITTKEIAKGKGHPLLKNKLSKKQKVEIANNMMNFIQDLQRKLDN